MARLGDIATYINGYAFKPTDWSNTGLPIIRIQDLTGNSYQANRYGGEYDTKYEVNDGDVLISWSASLGVYVWHGEKAVLNQHIFKVVFDKADVSKEFFIYQVENILRKAVTEVHGATMKHLTKPVFDSLPFFLPTLSEQQRIANILDKITGLISLRKQQLAKLDELVKARFVEMFGEPVSNPMGWKETTVGAECYYIKDGPHKSLPDVDKENGYPFISVRNIVSGNIDFSTAKYISKQDYFESIKKCHPQKGDMLYSKGGTTGIAKLIDVDIEFANWVHVAVLKFDDSLNGIFFEKMLNSDYCYDQSQKLTKGIANKDLVLSAMAQIKMYKPPLALQEQFASFVAQVDKSKSSIQQSLNELETLKKALMQQYFG